MTQQPDPYTVLGVSPKTPLAEVRARYRVLAMKFHPDRQHATPENAYQEANRRMAELTIAYKLIADQLRNQEEPRTPEGPPSQGRPPHRPHGANSVNPRNVPLQQLPLQGPVDTTRFKGPTKLEPIMIRLETGTGLTACTPMIHYVDSRTSFLSDGPHLHLAASADGLISLLEAAGLRRATTLVPSDIVVARSGHYDFPEALAALSDGLRAETLLGLIKVYDLSYRLGVSLGLDDLVTAISSPGSGLRRFYHLAVRVNSGELSHWEAWRRIRAYDRYDFAAIAAFMSKVVDRLALRIEWRA